MCATCVKLLRIKKVESRQLLRPEMSALIRSATKRSIDSSQTKHAIPAGRSAQNFRLRIFRERNARARSRWLSRHLTSPESSQDRHLPRPSFSKSPGGQIAKKEA